MWIVLVLIVMYVLSAVWCYKEIKEFHDELEYLTPDFIDMLVVFIPVVNFAIALATAGDNGKGKRLAKRFYGRK